jgi:alpha-tubulin suppressor-like RCC1 family protein
MTHNARLGAGNHFSLVLVPTDTSLLSFGENLFAQLGRPPVGVEVNLEPAPVTLPADFEGAIVEISAGLLHGALLDDDGDVWTWGFGLFGRLGQGDTLQVDAPKKVAALDDVVIVNVEMGNGASYAIDADGRVWGWGQNTSGQLGLGAHPGDATDPVDGPLLPTLIDAFAGKAVVDLATGTSFAVVLTADGDVFAMGSNVQGQAGPNGGDERRVPLPVEVPIPGDVVAVGASNNTAFAVTTDGEVYGWGETRFGQLLIGDIQPDGTLLQGDGDDEAQRDPVLLADVPSGVVDVDGGARWVLALDEQGEVWGWGRNNEGWLGIGTATGDDDSLLAPTKSPALDDVEIVEIAAGTNHSLARDNAGNVYGWGAVGDGRLGVVEAHGPLISPSLIDLSPGPNDIDLLVGDQRSDAILRFVDLNDDGDAVDPGEVRVYFDGTNESGLVDPTGNVFSLFRAVDGGVFFGDGDTDAVYRLDDLNGDGDANDTDEARIWFSDAGNAGEFTLVTPNGLHQTADGALYIVQAGTGTRPEDAIYRTVDLNADGDAEDDGEATLWLDIKTRNENSSAFDISFVGDVAYVSDSVGGVATTPRSNCGFPVPERFAGAPVNASIASNEVLRSFQSR